MLMAMHDSVNRLKRYPIQPSSMGLGDGPDVYEEGYKTFVNRVFKGFEKKAPASYVRRVKEEIKNNRWQRAHDMIYIFFENPKNPALPFMFQKVGPVASATAPKSFGIGGLDNMACCSGCATGAPCCGHDHSMHGIPDVLKSTTTMLVVISALAASATAPRGKKLKYVLIGGAFGFALQALFPDIKKVFE